MGDLECQRWMWFIARHIKVMLRNYNPTETQEEYTIFVSTNLDCSTGGWSARLVQKIVANGRIVEMRGPAWTDTTQLDALRSLARALLGPWFDHMRRSWEFKVILYILCVVMHFYGQVGNI